MGPLAHRPSNLLRTPSGPPGHLPVWGGVHAPGLRLTAPHTGGARTARRAGRKGGFTLRPARRVRERTPSGRFAVTSPKWGGVETPGPPSYSHPHGARGGRPEGGTKGGYRPAAPARRARGNSGPAGAREPGGQAVRHLCRRSGIGGQVRGHGLPAACHGLRAGSLQAGLRSPSESRARLARLTWSGVKAA